MSYFARIMLAFALFIIGFLFSITIVGAIIGVPMILAGFYISYKAQKQHAKEVIRDGVAEALREAKEQGKEEIEDNE